MRIILKIEVGSFYASAGCRNTEPSRELVAMEKIIKEEQGRVVIS
jgi:hypothetical protein